jgi:hypothetical protein
LLGRIDELVGSGYELKNLDTGAPITEIRDHIQSANAYLGAFPIAEALATGADVVVTGRCSDAALALGPMLAEFSWKAGDWDLLAAGVAAGHVIECGAQATGGNCQFDWQTTPDFAHIGFPVLEAHPDGRMVITKQAGTGGRVTEATVKEQLVYEIGDPAAYITPDVIADFTTIQLAGDGENRIAMTGVKGARRPEMLKASVSYHYGWKCVGSLVYSAPDAKAKAETADRMVRQRLGARDRDRVKLERFSRELIPLVLNGPPTATGYGEGRPAVREVVAYWPTLVPRSAVEVSIEVIG